MLDKGVKHSLEVSRILGELFPPQQVPAEEAEPLPEDGTERTDMTGPRSADAPKTPLTNLPNRDRGGRAAANRCYRTGIEPAPVGR